MIMVATIMTLVVTIMNFNGDLHDHGGINHYPDGIQDDFLNFLATLLLIIPAIYPVGLTYSIPPLFQFS